MKRTTIKLTKSDISGLGECIRRVQCFHKGRMEDNLLLLARRSEVKGLMEKNIVELSGYYAPNVICWFHMTPLGIKILKQFKRKGLFSKPYDYSPYFMDKLPPSVTVYE